MNASGKKLAMFLVLLLGLAPMVAFGAAGASAPAPTPFPTDQGRGGPPPVEQALVPQGVFAIQLLEALKLGSTQDEAKAESQLSAVGVEPKNGWIAGYPMTPPAMVEIEKSIGAAAEGGKLKMSKEEALKAVGDLKTKLGLNVNPEGSSQPPVTAGGVRGNTVIYKYTDRDGVIHFTDQYESIPKEYRDRVEMIRETVRPPVPSEPTGQEMQTPAESSYPGPGSEVVNNYYYDNGPPVVSYYPPPDPYYYLYSWVPYPFWWGPGFYFSGFFILHDFHRHVGFHGRSFVCSNHVVAHNQSFIVNPQTRGLQASTMAGRVSSPQAFNSARVQSSARTIVGMSQSRPAFANVQGQPRIAAPTATAAVNRFQAPPRPSSQQRVNTGPVNAPGNNFGRLGAPPARTFSPPPARTFSAPPSGGRFFAPSPPRVASAPPAAAMHGPVYGTPGSRGSFGSVHSSGGFSGGGGFGSRGGSFHGGGGSRGGGHR